MIISVNTYGRIHRLGEDIRENPLKAKTYYLLDTDDMVIECYTYDEVYDIIVNKGINVLNIIYAKSRDILYHSWFIERQLFSNLNMLRGRVKMRESHSTFVDVVIVNKIKYVIYKKDDCMYINDTYLCRLNLYMPLNCSGFDYMYRKGGMFVGRYLLLDERYELRGLISFLFDNNGVFLGAVYPDCCLDYSMTDISSKFALLDERIY